MDESCGLRRPAGPSLRLTAGLRLVPGNIPGGSRTLPLLRRCQDRSRRGRGLSQDLIEQRGAATRGLLLSSLAMLVSVFGITCLADYFRDLILHQTCDGVVQQQTATRTIIVDQITETWGLRFHDKDTSRMKPRAKFAGSQRIISRPGQKSTARKRMCNR